MDQIGGIETTGYNCFVRIHTATEYDGGLSESTVYEAVSWGKYQKEAQHISVWCDSTIFLSILVVGLL